jgi:superfamily II DNA or RNA helicase
MTLQVPPRFQKFFRPATLSTAGSALAKSRVVDVLFFRSAYMLTITENETRRFQPRFQVGTDGRVAPAACSCAPELRPNDLCRHIAIALHHVCDGEDHLAERYGRSLWYEIGQLFAEEVHEPAHVRKAGRIDTYVHGDERIALSLSFPESLMPSILSAYPAEVRGEGVAALPQREQLLRRMSITPQEAELQKRGVLSRRQVWEQTFWFGWSRECFGLFADHDLQLESGDGEFHLRGERGEIVVDVKLPRRAVARILERDGGELARRSGIDVRPEEGRADLLLELTERNELRLVPVILATLGGQQRIDRRQALEPNRFDRWFFYPEASTFVSVASSPRRFAEAARQVQGSLFATGGTSGYTRDSDATVPGAELFTFLEKHASEIRSMGDELVPPVLKDVTPMRLQSGARLHFLSIGDSVEVDLSWDVAGATVSWRTIASARRQGDPALVAGRHWIDLSDPQFAWVDSLAPTQFALPTLRLSRLDYVRLRYLLRGEVTFEGDSEAEAFYRSFEEVGENSSAPAATDLGFELYPYQHTGYRWLWFLQQNGLGGLLCDDMGLGKTHQAMVLVRALVERHPEARTLVVCPTSLIDHWREKLATYAPTVRASLFYGDRRKLDELSQIVITSYGTLRNDIDELATKRFDLVILDEAQTIKNRGSQTHAAVSRLQRAVAIGLTGTPVENRLEDLHALIDFVVPGYLPGEAEFERSFVRPIERGNAAARERLHRLVHPFILRRTKTQVLRELPPKIVDVRHCELTAGQKELYREVLAGRARPLREGLASKSAKVSYLHIFAVLNHLKQICNHPITFDPRYAQVDSAKWNLFTELLDEALESGLKVVVFSQYVRMLKLIEHYLDGRSIGWATIKGDTKDRGRMLERFRREDDCRVFTASLRAGGLGIDLTSASVVIHYDRWWNQAREDQATDRVHRLGQNRGVQVLKLITRGTLEEKIDLIISRKGRLAEDLVREDDPTLVKQFTRDEIASLLEDVE